MSELIRDTVGKPGSGSTALISVDHEIIAHCRKKIILLIKLLDPLGFPFINNYLGTIQKIL